MIRKLLLAVAAMTLGATAFAQVEPAAKETGKAVAESTKEAGRNVKAATERGPNRSMDKARAHVHRAKAHAHKHRAKHAADAAIH